MRNAMRPLAILSLAAVLSLAGCAPPPTPLPTPITVQLAWTHQAQFAGLYAAESNGLYAAEGLAVSFVEGGVEVDKLAPVLAGTAQFGVASADELILARSQGLPVRALATIFRRSPIIFVSDAKLNFTRPQDFVGKTIRVSANVVATLRAMMAWVGIGPDQYTVVYLPSDLALFDSGDVPVWGIFSSSFGVTLKQAGYQLNTVYPDDYGVHFYGDTLFTTDAYAAAHADQVLRFVRASLAGWTYAIENPEAMPAVVQQYAPAADPAIEDAQMLANLPLVNTGEDHIGWMKPDAWAAMAVTLRTQGVLTQTLDVTQVYTLQYLEEIYK